MADAMSPEEYKAAAITQRAEGRDNAGRGEVMATVEFQWIRDALDKAENFAESEREGLVEFTKGLKAEVKALQETIRVYDEVNDPITEALRAEITTLRTDARRLKRYIRNRLATLDVWPDIRRILAEPEPPESGHTG